MPTSRKDALAIERLPDGGFIVTEHHRHGSGYQDTLRYAATTLTEALGYIEREMGEPKKADPAIVRVPPLEFPTPPFPPPSARRTLECFVEVHEADAPRDYGMRSRHPNGMEPEVREHEEGQQVTR